MNQKWIPPVVIFGNFVLLALPLIGVAVLFRYLGHNEPLFANYLVILSPVGWLVWGICKERGLHETDNKVLRACSVINKVLILVFLGVMMLYIGTSCEYGCKNFKVPGEY